MFEENQIQTETTEFFDAFAKQGYCKNVITLLKNSYLLA